jgi:hypothetical protein
MNFPGNQTEHNRKNENKNSHSSFVVFSGFPVGVSHGELVEIREQRRDHRVGWPVQDPPPTGVLHIRTVLFRLHYLLPIPRVWLLLLLFGLAMRLYIRSIRTVKASERVTKTRTTKQRDKGRVLGFRERLLGPFRKRCVFFLLII